MPARQAFLVQMVEEKDDLGNAIALNSSMVNIARLVGPSLAGAVIAVSGEGYCFLLDGMSYLAVIASLIAMRGVTIHGRAAAHGLDARAIERRLGIRFRVRADSHHPADVRDCELDGMAVHGADADIRRENSEGRTAYARISDGRRRSGRADFGDIAGGAENRAGTWENDSAFRGRLRRWTDSLWALAKFLDFASR